MKNTVTIRGINLVYDDLGAGDAIVFIHGQPFNRSMWKDQVDEFSATHRLIIPDLRGYGDSGITERIVLLDEIALDVLHLLEELDIRSAVFVGLSMGGQIVFDLYRLRPGLFAGIVLADTDARAETGEGYLNRINLSKKIAAEGMSQFTAERIHHFMCENTFQTQPATVAHLTEMMTTTSAAGAAAVQRGRAERRDHTPILGDIHCPTLVIVGEEDAFTPVATAEYMHTRIPGSVLKVIEKSGHLPNMEQPEKFNAVLREFLGRR
jgi:pimeloyl-ACP methyl ester carboxylesterase